MTEKRFDIIVIGGGPGGYVAAIRAAQLGLKTALIESTHLGGVCLNWGCIPTKALLRSSEIYTLMKHAEAYGLNVQRSSFDLSKVVERSRNVATQLSKGVQHLLKKNKVTVYNAKGKLVGRVGQHHKVMAGSETLLASHVILATGARARDLPGLKTGGKSIWTYREAMVPKTLPETLLIVGSGAIGIEFASFYNALGSQVTVVEIMNRILPAEDEEISGLAQKAFEKKGIRIKTSTSLHSIDQKEITNAGKSVNVRVTFETPQGPESMDVEKVILAVGIIGNTENLGLEGTKVKIEKNHIVVNEWGETGESGIYAIGDVAGAPWLAHKASHEGVIVVERIAGVKGLHPLKRENIPGCTYSHPQIASIGLSEKDARQAGADIKVGRFPFIGNGKAIAMGEPEGLVKTIFDAQTGELLGAHMIGSEVTELIQGYAIAKAAEATEAELMQTIFPHPTLSEMMHESVLDAYGRVIHL
jgi:dihydrolipoamide dehydrogenase